MNKQSYDIIGDIHGQAGILESLLRNLGYNNAGDTWIHPGGRKVIFVGDFIDRGPEIRRTLHIVRAMVEAGDGLAIMGNHEYNALCYAKPDGNGGFFRPHTKGNANQHAATLEAFRGREDEWKGYLEWFTKLPLFLDMSGLRVVHACWDARAIQAIDPGGGFSEDMLHAYGTQHSPTQKAADLLLKGPEVNLPNHLNYTDKEGIVRKEARIKWWLNSPRMTYREITMQLPFVPPDEAVPKKFHSRLCGYPSDAPPVLFGHYGYLKPADSLAGNVACIDLGVSLGGPLCAYRWDNERILDPAKFVTARAMT
jgi:hypothetical protein